MIHRIYMLIILLTLSALLLFACSATASSNTATGKVPANLATIEAQAEDIIDVASNGNWQTINADIATISNAWNAYKPQTIKDGATTALLDSFNSAFDRLQTAASAQDKTGTMQAANDMSAVVVDLFDLYHPTIPADVGRLDVLERQAVLDTAAGNFTAVSDDLVKINQVWETLKQSVLVHKGQDTAKQFEASLDAQAVALAAQDATTLTSEARNALEIVDVIEQLY
jgi:hypothetical protein